MQGDFIPVKAAALIGINSAQNIKDAMQAEDEWELDQKTVCPLNVSGAPNCEACE